MRTEFTAAEFREKAMKHDIKTSEIQMSSNKLIKELSLEDVALVSGGGCEVVGQTCHLDGHTVRCESYSVVCK